MTNCTVSGNSTNGYGGGVSSGTFYNGAPTLALTDCTISANSAGYGGGLLATGTTTLTNTIVAGKNVSTLPNAGNDIYATSLSGTNNLIGAGYAGGLVNGVNGNLVGREANPLLAPLGNYGGPTQTEALLPGSPAINAGTSTGAPLADQRGLGRVGAVDIGAFESQGFKFTVVPASSTPQTASTSSAAFCSALAVNVTANNPVEPVNGGVVTLVAHPAANAVPRQPCQGSSAVIASGQAAVTAAPNNVDGSYTSPRHQLRVLPPRSI